MADTKLLEYHAFRKMVKLLLLGLGLLPLEHPSRFCYILPYIQLFVHLGTVVPILAYVRVHFKNIALVTAGLSTMASSLTAMLKVTCIIVNRKDAFGLYKNLASHFEKMLNDPNLKDIILNRITTYYRLSLYTTGIGLITIGTYISAPIIFIIRQHIHHVEPIEYLLPYPGIYPWKIPPNGILYKCHYLFGILTTFNMFLASLFEPLFSLYVFQIIGQIREMTYRVSNIDTTNESELRQCVVQYATMVRYRNILQKIYGPFILWVIVINGIILCAVMFQLTQMETVSIGRAVLFTAYIGFKLMQTFIYAWAGTQLTVESEDYLAAVYSANWYRSKRYMTYVLITLAQKPLTLTACNFSVVSLDIFRMVLNTALSYFFLLQKLDNTV